MNRSAYMATTSVTQPRRLMHILLYGMLMITLTTIWSALASQADAGSSPTDLESKGVLPTCDPEWTIVTSTNVGTATNTLYAVSAVSTNDIWAVGSYRSSGADRTLIERWNGTGWNVVSSPNVGPSDNSLSGVEVVSANDVWAVGTFVTGTTNKTFVMRWNGTTWNGVVSPNAGTGDNFLRAVAAVSANDVWAVGYYLNGTVYRTLALHWNGSVWTQVSIPNVGSTLTIVTSITTISANDVWAIGYYEYAAGIFRTLTIHWNGSAWTVVASPNVGTSYNLLYGVSAISATNIWAVGWYWSSGPGRTLILQWNGTTWNAVTSPNASTEYNYLHDVVAISANDVWAVGNYYNSASGNTLIEHWNGSIWSIVTSPNTGIDHTLYAVTAISANDVWAVGKFDEEIATSTLVERFNPCVASPTPTTTPSPSSTPTSTNTSAPTQTPGGPTATPVACIIEFTDVLPGSTFYDFVRCMACRGIINGYTSGCETGNPCFRPTNNVTRGQLSKIVANAAGFTEPAGSRQFEDVPPASTFYDFVWRLADRGHVSGYACGSAGEPCGAGNLPYFRPNGNASRGQISKIVANSAGLPDPPGTQLFEDVPPSHTFHDFIQRLANLGVIGGYVCGGAGEPCGAGNLPYFRPASNATRGQTSKIVANAFYPNCATP